MRLSLSVGLCLAVMLCACSQPQTALMTNLNTHEINQNTDIIKNFSPEAYYQSSINMQEVSKQYFSQSPLQRLQFHLQKWSRTPYKLGGQSPKTGADCSAFTQALLAQSFGIFLPRSTIMQKRFGKKVAKNKLKTADLLFFRSSGPNRLHVGIYLSHNQFVHLSEHGGARIQSLNQTYWAKRFIEARRY